MGFIDFPKGLKIFTVYHRAFNCDRTVPSSSQVLAKNKTHARDIFNAIRAKKMTEPQWYYFEWNEVTLADVHEVEGLGVLNPDELTSPTELLKPTKKKV